MEFSCPVYEVNISLKGLPSGILHHTIHIAQAQSYTVPDLILSTFCINVMLMSKAGAYWFAEPVSVHTSLYFEHSLITKIVETDLRKRVAGIVLIDSGKSLEFELLPGIHQVIVTQIGKRYSIITLIRELQSSTRRGLGFNHDHTIGRLRSIDGGRCGILQDSDRRHPVHIKVHDGLQRGLETIEDEQWLVRVSTVFLLQTGDTRLSSDFNIRHYIGIRAELTALHHFEGRIQGAEALEDIRCSHGLEFISLESGRGSCKTLLLSLVYSGHHHISQLRDIGKHYDLGKGRCILEIICDHLVIIADV